MMNYVLDGVMGLCVADALGVPVEFEDRDSLSKNPVVDMRAYGTYNQPQGTWSDDSSMTLCLVDSLSKGLDYNNVMVKFLNWINDGEYSPHGEVFDIGVGTRKALFRFQEGITPLECGGKSEWDNGNGSLMRILPILFYLKSVYGTDFLDNDESFEIIHNVSALTHGHERSLMCCGIYISVALMLLDEMDVKTAVELGIYKAMEYYRRQDDFRTELRHFVNLEKKDFINFPVEKIKSSGYVIDTLEAAIWCLLNTNDYKTCVLKAVNLGNDTDTVAAIAGGLAGLKYGNENIPKDWVEVIVNRKYIEDLCNKLYTRLNFS